MADDGNVVRQFPAPDRQRLFSTRVVRVSDLHDKEPAPTEYVVPGVIPDGLVTLVSGPSGVGKTMLFQQLMTACAAEKPWLGRDVHGCRSFAIFSEDDGDKLHSRQIRICEHYGIEPLDFEDKAAWIPDDDTDPILFIAESKWASFVRPTNLWQQVATYCRNNEIGLLILDNVATVYAGDEYNKHQVRSAIRFLNSEARKLQLAIVLLLHPPKDRAKTYFAGSQQWENSARHVMSLDWPQPERPEDPQRYDEMTLRVRNGNYVPQDDAMKTDGLPMCWERGIIVRRELELTRRLGLGQLDKLELDGRVLSAIRYIVDRERGRVSPDPRSPNSLWSRVNRSPKWRGYKRHEIEASVERLRDGGKLVDVALGEVWLIRPTDCRYLGEPVPAE